MKKLLRNPIVQLILIAAVLIPLVLLFLKFGFLLMQGKPDIIIITVNSLRPDHLSPYGYNLLKTPALESLSENSTLFEKAYCSVPHPAYSYASILSGKISGGFIDQSENFLKVKDSYDPFHIFLRENGYSTTAIVSNPLISEETGFSEGFDSFENTTLKALKEGINFLNVEPPTKEAIEVLKKSKENNSPIFLWIEYSMPQFYSREQKQMNIHPYDAYVSLVDGEIKKIIKELRLLKMYKNSIIVFTSGAGTSLGEHEETSNAVFIYDSTVKVPLIIKYPYPSEKKRTLSLSSHIDIAPTLLSSAGIAYPSNRFEGIDLTSKEENSLYLENLNGYFTFGWSPVVGLVNAKYKYIELPSPELYDLQQDPSELKNIYESNLQEAQRMKEELLSYMKEKRPSLLPLVDKGTDPKKVMPLLKPLTVRKRDFPTMIAWCEKILAVDPDNKQVNLMLAKIYFDMGEYRKAEKILVHLTGVYPDLDLAWETLGITYEQLNETSKAALCYEKALELNSLLVPSLNNLAWYHLKEKINLEKALELAEKAYKINPNSTEVMDTLAEIHIALDNKGKAKELFQKALSIEISEERKTIFRQKINGLHNNKR